MTREEIVAKIKSGKLFQKFMDSQKNNGLFNVSISGAEKWNLTGDEEPNEKGKYDIEGHTWTDIYADYNMNPFTSWDDFKSMAKALKDWLVDDVLWYRQFGLKTWIENAIATWPLKRTWNSWIFTVESFRTYAGDMAMESKAFEEAVEAGNAQEAGMILTEEEKKIQPFMVHEYLMSNGYHMLHPGMYVSEQDPTVIVANENIWPFDMKDGWSDWNILNILGLYFTKLGYESPVVKYETDGVIQYGRAWCLQDYEGERAMWLPEIP